MSRCSLMLLAVSLVIGAEPPKDAPTQAELKKLEGTWEPVSFNLNGMQLPEKDLAKAKLVIVGDRWLISFPDGTYEPTFTIDPTRKPKAIDFKDSQGGNQGKTIRGIYVVEGNRMKVCRPIEGDKERPAKFAAEADSGLTLVVWKRVKS